MDYALIPTEANPQQAMDALTADGWMVPAGSETTVYTLGYEEEMAEIEVYADANAVTLTVGETIIVSNRIFEQWHEISNNVVCATS